MKMYVSYVLRITAMCYIMIFTDINKVLLFISTQLFKINNVLF